MDSKKAHMFSHFASRKPWSKKNVSFIYQNCFNLNRDKNLFHSNMDYMIFNTDKADFEYNDGN